MDGWRLLTYLHLLSMAFFVGGQLFMASVVVPAMRGESNREPLRKAGRYFAYASGIALVVLLATGSMLAGHFQLWDSPKLHLKLALVALVIVLIVWHSRKTDWHWLEGLVFLVSLVITWLGVSLMH